MSESGWSLHPQLQADTTPVGDLALSRVLAINDADYPWLILVPRRLKHDPEKWNPVFGKDHAQSEKLEPGSDFIRTDKALAASEIADLGGDDAARLMTEIAQASRILKDVTRCDKLNIAAIGNVVPQLHVHITARSKDDTLWPKPVWGFSPQRRGDPAAFQRFVGTIRDGLGIAADCQEEP